MSSRHAGGLCEWWWDLPPVCDGEGPESPPCQLPGPLGPVLGATDDHADRIRWLARRAAWKCAASADEQRELAAGFAERLAARPDWLAEHTNAWIVQRLIWINHNDRRRAGRRAITEEPRHLEDVPREEDVSWDEVVRGGSVGYVEDDGAAPSVWVHGRAVEPETWVMHGRPARKRRNDRLRRELAKLDAVTLKAAELLAAGVTQAEVAAGLGISQQAISKRMATARQKLAEFSPRRVVQAGPAVSMGVEGNSGREDLP